MDHDIFHAGAFPELGVRPGLKILPTALLSHQALELVRCCEAGASTEGGGVDAACVQFCSGGISSPPARFAHTAGL